MAGLSSNVMNMKFMQKAQAKKEKQQKDDEIKKIKDSSEWVLPNRSALRKNLKPSVKVQTVGYGSIATLTKDEDEEEKKEIAENVVQKDEKTGKVVERKVPEPTSLKVSDEASKFLASIAKGKKNKKRKNENSEGQRKKKKV